MHDDSLVIVGEKSDNVDDGELLYRDVAVVLYMVDDQWDGDKDGGVLLDWGPTSGKFAAPKKIVPKFNRLVCFQVPRFHEVTKVVGGSEGGEDEEDEEDEDEDEEEEDRPRLSLFGWFLTDKKLYETSGKKY
jgi:Rps23 Pro-64 3,4-dihydroxylase Tpa1-like proline 4-hydroxylase